MPISGYFLSAMAHHRLPFDMVDILKRGGQNPTHPPTRPLFWGIGGVWTPLSGYKPEGATTVFHFQGRFSMAFVP